jgi:acyl-CoA synthetase (AMP-forming)/AMP-acid ligase II
MLHAHKGINSALIEIDPTTLTHRTLTTDQLDLAAQSMANYMQNQGYGPQDRIAIIADNCLESIVCYLATLKLGAVVVMISSKATPSQISGMLQDRNVKLVFTDSLVDTDFPVFGLVGLLDKFTDNTMFESYHPDDHDTAIILHTSGSTEKPRSVLITHQARLGMLLGNTGSPGLAKSLFANPFYHIMGMNCVDMNLYSKNDLYFLKKFNPVAYLKTIDQLHPTNLAGVPPMFSLLVLQQELIPTLDLSSVQNIVLAGGSTTPSLYQQLTQTFINANIHIGYGSTELGPGIFGQHKTLPKPPTSVGCEKEGILYRLVDQVLQVRSPLMMKGYDDNNYNFTHDGYYITNDQFEIDRDGFYYFVGRSDDMFKSGGNKIFPSEIEQVVEQHPSVDKCVALPVEDAVKEFKPYAFVTLTPGTTITSEEIVLFLQDKLARYQLPRKLWIIDKMPLSAVNKIDKQQLKVLAKQNLNI